MLVPCYNSVVSLHATGLLLNFITLPKGESLKSFIMAGHSRTTLQNNISAEKKNGTYYFTLKSKTISRHNPKLILQCVVQTMANHVKHLFSLSIPL